MNVGWAPIHLRAAAAASTVLYLAGAMIRDAGEHVVRGGRE